MHTSIHNPNLLITLTQKYHTDLYIFINELNIAEAKSDYNNKMSVSESLRKIKVHYTILDQKGNDIIGGAAIVFMPSHVNDMNRIVNTYFSKIAEDICSSLPTPVLNKQELFKKGRR